MKGDAMQDIKAIETEYNGYRFRSRLEARWAVFFDAAGVKYQYEPEGFEVKWSDTEIYRYLPDFYLPDFNVWVEVKPNKQKLLEDAEKITMCIDYGNTPISESNGLLILGQIPKYNPDDECDIAAFNLLWWDSGVLSGAAEFIYNGEQTFLNINHDCFAISSAPDMPDLLSNEDLIFMKKAVWRDFFGFDWWLGKKDLFESSMYMIDFYDKARSARFEFGERG